jgi:Sulfotransferase family/Glycosyltransferase sugar-binding region containing DXD motif
MLIPRVFHQIWLGPDPLPEEYRGYQQTWLDCHPGWEQELWTEDRLPAELRRPEAAEKLRAPAERANILRLELLWRFGGVYVDTDFECLRSIEPLIEGAELFITLAKPDRVNNALMGSVAGHPVIDEALRQIRPVEFYGHDKAATGTRFLDELLLDRPGVTLLDHELFYPQTDEGRQQAFAIHHMARSWKNAEQLRLDLDRAERKIAAQKEIGKKRKLRYQRAEAELDRIQRTWPRRLQRGAKRAARREEPRTFCLFIGYPRSGHTLVGSLLDAHPDVAIANEVNVLRLLEDGGLTRGQLVEMLLTTSEEDASRSLGRRATGYSYAVPLQWQGQVRRLRVLGAKAGEKTTARVARDPAELKRLRRLIRARVRILHVTRNPFDMIARMALIEKGGRPERTLAGATKFVARLARMNARIISENERTVLTVRHESLIDDPRGELRRICSFLGIEPDQSWLEASAGILFETPRRSRDLIEWTKEERETVEQMIAKHDFFRGYSWTDAE